MTKLRIANPGYLVDINDLAPELGYLITDPTLVRIGAMARHREILESEALAAVCPIFRDAERVIADPVVRNRGTLGGSLCQADPAEDLSTVCTVLDAVCLARGSSGEREIAIDEFQAGPYETTLAPSEMLVEVRIPVRHNTSSAYAKVERRVGDWAVTAAGAAVTLNNDTITAAPVPHYPRKYAPRPPGPKPGRAGGGGGRGRAPPPPPPPPPPRGAARPPPPPPPPRPRWPNSRRRWLVGRPMKTRSPKRAAVPRRHASRSPTSVAPPTTSGIWPRN